MIIIEIFWGKNTYKSKKQMLEVGNIGQIITMGTQSFISMLSYLLDQKLWVLLLYLIGSFKTRSVQTFQPII